ncbi:PaaX family transcriptional regulator C-terminal domain-containing protein [Alicyclobacillus pomorum]|jgi:phenylacetic acid degradation operon negative regulatory protein|uniref:PaaX family transcriptional regulator n=1 Tax=Alicyclobacillus pomorum TaxID=204470 RepID=UPI000425279C|nr:PaaX family transcriptional regulator C-terminal domain-containing protein [Alicyclobacillus pomorum]
MRPVSLCFTLFGDYFRDLNMEVWVGSLIRYLEPFGITSGATRVTLSRMVQQEFVTARRIGQKSFYRLSDKGKRRILDGVTRVYDWDDERWDRNWQVVSCNLVDVEKDLRDSIQKELQWMGFGSLGRGMWICPHQRYSQLKQMMDEYQIQPHVHVFTGTYEGLGSPLDLVSQAWNLPEIEEKYESFLREFGPKFQRLHQLGVQGSLSERDAFVERALLVHEYRKFLFVDPRLPKELLPANWAGEQARKLFKDFHEFLSPLAEKYFYDHLEIADSA